MAKFFVGQMVRLIHVEDPLDPEADDWGAVGDEGHVVAEGRYFSGNPIAGYDCVCHFPSYGGYCAWGWQLEPILPDGHRASEFSFTELMDRCREGVSA